MFTRVRETAGGLGRQEHGAARRSGSIGELKARDGERMIAEARRLLDQAGRCTDRFKRRLLELEAEQLLECERTCR